MVVNCGLESEEPHGLPHVLGCLPKNYMCLKIDCTYYFESLDLQSSLSFFDFMLIINCIYVIHVYI